MKKTPVYYPLYIEELFIVQLYGTDEEVKRFNELMDIKTDDDQDDDIVIEIVALIEEIKRKNLTKMNWFCCHRCENFKICRINWHRSERNLEKKCCTYCSHYEKCYKNFKENSQS